MSSNAALFGKQGLDEGTFAAATGGDEGQDGQERPGFGGVAAAQVKTRVEMLLCKVRGTVELSEVRSNDISWKHHAHSPTLHITSENTGGKNSHYERCVIPYVRLPGEQNDIIFYSKVDSIDDGKP